MRRSDTLKVLFVCVCVSAVCPAHPCGDNPLLVVEHYSRVRGLRSEEFMVNLRASSPDTYNRLMDEYQSYMDCTRAVQTGYYKRSVDDNANSIQHSFDNIVTKNNPSQPVTNLFKDAMREMLTQKQKSGESISFWKGLQNGEKGNIHPLLTPEGMGSRESVSSQIDALPSILKRLLQNQLPVLDANYINNEDIFQNV